MNKPLYLLIEDSIRFFRERQLKKAVNAAQIALEFGNTDTSDSDGLVRVHLQLSLVYSTNALYQCDPSYYSKAYSHLQEAKAISNKLKNNETTVGVFLIEGQYYLSTKDYSECRACFENALKMSKASDAQILAHSGLAALCIANNNVADALIHAKTIETLLNGTAKANAPLLWAEMYQIYSQSYILQQEYSKSLEMSQELLQLAKIGGDAEKEVIALRNIAVVCGVKSNYKIGMQYFLEALTKCEAIGYKELIVHIQINIGTLYAHLYNYEEAIKRYESVLGNHSEVLDPKTRTVVFNNLGNIYLTSEQPEIALDFFQKANRLASELQFQELLAYSTAQLGRTNIALNRMDEAKSNSMAAHKMFDKLATSNGKQINLLNLASLAFEELQFDQAYEYAMTAAALSRQIKDDSSEIKAYKQLAQIFKLRGDFEQAFEYQEKYATIQEEFSRVQRTRHNLDMEIRHAIREQQKEIELLTKENEYQSQLLYQGEKIARQNDELLRANEDLRQFAYIASHDLKEPLRMIGSFSQVIHKIAKPHLSEKDQEYFKFVLEGVTRMNNLLDGLLRYSVISQNSDELVSVDLNEVLTLCMANLKIRIVETDDIIERGLLPTIKGVQQLYVQLFQNLISNAIKFVEKGKQPQLRITSFETPEHHIIGVTDNGIGISEENQTKIFEIFKRLHHQSEYEGTGIGLAICQKIMNRMNGSIKVQSELGKGTTFSLIIPKELKQPTNSHVQPLP
ncbi:MAG: tetratricopeptide repeat protein [Saprospiraceae bacterium]|nr:tetratricopeptide repeat protein [Saprospiraceae bacterium]